MYSLMMLVKTVKHMIVKVIGYTVWSTEYQAVHYCLSMKEAQEWIACYDDAVVSRLIMNRRAYV